MTTSSLRLGRSEFHTITVILAVVAAMWATVVVWAAESGWLASLYPPLIGPLIALGIALPSAAYFTLPILRRYFAAVGVYPLSVLHVWRIPAALLFFWYGVYGQLPLMFWVLAGVGDLIAGIKALPLLRGPGTRDFYLGLHRFGFADFVVAVGTGLTFTLLHDPLMATIRHLPMALIPLFGVCLTGAAHLIAFDLLRKK